jgi:MFS family permease
MWMLIYYLPLYYEGLRGYSPLIAGIAAFPETFTVAPIAVLVGIMISRTGRYLFIVWMGWLLTTLGTGLLCLLDIDTPILGWVIINIVLGIGLGMLIPAESTAIHAANEKDDVPYAVSMYSLLRAAGQSLGVAVGGAVFNTRLRSLLGQNWDITDETAATTAEALLRMLQDVNNGDTQVGSISDQVLKEAVRKALQAVWATSCGLAGLTTFSHIMMREIDLGPRQMSH